MKQNLPYLRIIINTFILSFLLICISNYSIAQTSDNTGAVVRVIKCSDGPDKDISITITIDPQKIQDFEKGYQRLCENIPEGYSAKADASSNVKAETKEGQLRFYWMNGSMAGDKTTTVSYCLHKTGNEKIKSVIISGSFKYSVKNKNNEIIVNGDNTCKFR